MLVYFYDKDTKEYLFSETAQKDPEETKVQGRFVPLIPQYSTLSVPPIVGQNRIAVYNLQDKIWEEKEDYRKGYFVIDEHFDIHEIKTIGRPEGCIINEETANAVLENRDYFKFVDGVLKRKTKAEYEAEQAEKEKERIAHLSLTKREVLLAIYDDKGITPQDIEAILDTRSLIEFQFATSYFRGNPLIDSLGIRFGYSKEQLDYLFEHKEFEKESSGE